MLKLRSFVSCAAIGVGSALVGSLGGPATAHAQLRVDLTPFVGSYYALAKLGNTSTTSEEKQSNQPVIGGALFVRLTPAFGIEGAVTFTPSGSNITGATNQGFSGSIVFASARARLAAPRTNLYGLAGVGLVKRGGEAWNAPGFTSLTNLAGVLGFGTRAEVSPAVRIDVRAELQLYSVDPDGDGTAYQSKLQQDLIVTLGVPISLTRH